MAERPLLSSTALSTTLPEGPTTTQLQKRFITLIEEGEVVQALRLYRYAFFQTTLAVASLRVKQWMLRSLWRMITTYLESIFGQRIEEQSNLLLDCSDIDWAENRKEGKLCTAVQHVAADANVQRKRDIALGRCTLMIELMCRPNREIEISALKEIEIALS